MTADERNATEKHTIRLIQAVLDAHGQLRDFSSNLQITIENVSIVLQGTVPSKALHAQLVSVVRSAGVLRQVCNRVQVDGEPNRGAIQ